jgi:hypothetical protein
MRENEFSTATIVREILRIGRFPEPELILVIAAAGIRIDLSQDNRRESRCVEGGNRAHSSAIGAMQMCRVWPAQHGDAAQNTLAHTVERTKKCRGPPMAA